MKANIGTLVVVLFALALLVFYTGHQPWSTMRVVAVIVGLPSLALFVLARIELGDSFSVGAEARALVTRGIYSRIRNPIYVFGALTIAAAFLYMDRPLLLSLLLVVIPLQVRRARTEAKVLEAEFGEEYRQYRARTWF